jgi:hypothetical protein
LKPEFVQGNGEFFGVFGFQDSVHEIGGGRFQSVGELRNIKFFYAVDFNDFYAVFLAGGATYIHHFREQFTYFPVISEFKVGGEFGLLGTYISENGVSVF